ncbi:MAG: hypothetical protein LBB67_06725 [Oscillospiraceae bacterium]|jgi:hypothetical protein|nr:hypothetical protein [Oscillospiraceae bacterium]
MFDPEVSYEAMNFFEQWLMDIVDKIVTWIETALTATAITDGLNGVIEWGKETFGERNFAYGIVDFIDMVIDLIKSLGVL